MPDLPETTKAPAGPPPVASQPPPPEPDDEDDDTDTEQKRKRRPIDPEMKAMGDLCAILDRFEEPNRKRMMRYINGRYYPEGA